MELTKEKDYKALVISLKERINAAQIKAALAANSELIHLYWDIGYKIAFEQKEKGWGAKITTHLSADLRKAFPDMKGLSKTNLDYMHRFYETYPKLFSQHAAGKMEIYQHAVGKLPWGHNMLLLDKVKTNEERLWYALKTLENGWKRTILEHQISSGLYERQGKAKKISNFKKLLPKAHSELAESTLKDPYVFDFLNLSEEAKEKEMEDQLIQHLTKFLIELGAGFAFVGRQYHLEVGGEDFYIDLLFYHIHLKRYVVIELKMDKFKPEYAGQLNFYLTAIDKQLKRNDDKPTIGILLCPNKNNIVAEYALSDMSKPIGVSEYKLSKHIPEKLKEELPSIDTLRNELQTQLKQKKKP